MFRRRRQDPGSATQGDRPVLGYHSEAIAVANPDVPSIARERRLLAESLLGMQGLSGYVVGYDRGDPAHSLMADVAITHPGSPVPNPITAQARLGIADQIVLNKNPSYAEVPTAESIANGDSYRALLRRRITR